MTQSELEQLVQQAMTPVADLNRRRVSSEEVVQEQASKTSTTGEATKECEVYDEAEAMTLGSYNRIGPIMAEEDGFMSKSEYRGRRKRNESNNEHPPTIPVQALRTEPTQSVPEIGRTEKDALGQAGRRENTQTLVVEMIQPMPIPMGLKILPEEYTRINSLEYLKKHEVTFEPVMQQLFATLRSDNSACVATSTFGWISQRMEKQTSIDSHNTSRHQSCGWLKANRWRILSRWCKMEKS